MKAQKRLHLKQVTIQLYSSEYDIVCSDVFQRGLTWFKV